MYRQLAKEDALDNKKRRQAREAKRIATQRSLHKKHWTAEELKDHKKALRRIYYEKNRDKILQDAKDRRKAKKSRTRKATYPPVVLSALPDISVAVQQPLRKRSKYNEYVKNNFRLVKEENPHLKPSAVLTKVAHMWTSLKKSMAGFKSYQKKK